jgi:hypothetical protein
MKKKSKKHKHQRKKGFHLGVVAVCCLIIEKTIKFQNVLPRFSLVEKLTGRSLSTCSARFDLHTHGERELFTVSHTMALIIF